MAAILAAGLVVGAGAAATLATWSDSEWVLGGAVGADGVEQGVGTDRFTVQQDSGTGWSDHATQDEANALIFSAGALALSPGEAVYAPVALRSGAGSSAGSLLLNEAVAATGTDGGLWNALLLRIVVAATEKDPVAGDPVCDASSFSGGATYLVGSQAGGASLATGNLDDVRPVAANQAGEQHYCFEIALPESAGADPVTSTALQGKKVLPVWQFSATSD